ncbi:MAG: hypothetical protein WC565_06650 [Parcubacteria group bacterium]|jgi:hypothetical protein
MKDLATIVQIVTHLALVVAVCWFAFIVTRRLKVHHERLRLLEQKTGWLRVQEGPDNKVAVEGQLEALCISRQKDEEPPYAS